MLTWNEIKELQYDIKNRQTYEREYQVRKWYDKMLPTVDNIFSAFWLYLECNLAEKKSVKKSWECFVEDSKGTIIETWIKQMNGACCSDELKEYFNNKIRKQEDIVYAD